MKKNILDEFRGTNESMHEYQARLDMQIKELGGVVRKGLYQGARRVHAKLELGDWVISNDETDLISTIGVTKIPELVNLVDLRNKFGLTVCDELAPAKTNYDNGYIKITRTDEWGEGSKPFIDRRNWFQKHLDLRSTTDLVFFLLVPHLILTIIIKRSMSSRAIKWAGPTLFFSMITFTYWLRGEYVPSGWEKFGFVTAGFYIYIPIFYLFGCAFTEEHRKFWK
jgi:hypothetical protein